jgi:hypothetical protein
MKNLFSKGYGLYLLLSIGLFSACNTASDLTPQDNDPENIVGVFQVIIDPISCASPSTNAVTVTSEGAMFKVAFQSNRSQEKSVVTFSNITAEKTGKEVLLKLNGKDFGKYALTKYADFGSNGYERKEGMVLMLNYADEDAKKYVAFMGKK